MSGKLQETDKGPTDIYSEVADIAEGFASRRYKAMAAICLESDGGAHMVVIQGDEDRFKIMGLVAELATAVNAQKV